MAPLTTKDNCSLSLPLLRLRKYQLEAFQNRTNGIECWIWGRQTGKSFTLAAWAVDRLITRPGRLVTILSNSFSNGIELNHKCREIAQIYSRVLKTESPLIKFESSNSELRIKVGGRISRIKILPANPRTARGFTGDLILDEFAFQEDSYAIWAAAEPILSSNPDYLCRIASTPNGRDNMFFTLVSSSDVVTRKVPRSLAWEQGLIISHPLTREPITPNEARSLAYDKVAYDQNYECVFRSQDQCFLSSDLLRRAEDPSVGWICEDDWSEEATRFLSNPPSCLGEGRDFYVGVDVGRNRDLTVISVVEKTQGRFLGRVFLRLKNMRLPRQQELLEIVCRSPRFSSAQIDMTGLGLGLYEYTQRQFGERIRGLNFSSKIKLPMQHGNETLAKVPIALALTLLSVYEEGKIKHPIDSVLREELQAPRTILDASERVSGISCARSSIGHADHFWSLALAIDTAQRNPLPKVYVPSLRHLIHLSRRRFC